MIPSTRVPDASQITAVLARLQPDSALQQYTEMHKNDPYIVSLAIAESNRRKQARLGQQAATPVASKPVVPQEIEAISQSSALPEDVGIGALPAPNLSQIATGANGGIVAFAGGEEVEDQSSPQQQFARQYQAAAERAAKQLGVDPGIIIAQWGHETGWGKSVPGKNNLGNIKDFSKEGTGTPAVDKREGSKDRYRNYSSPEEFADDYAALIKRKWPEAVGAGGDPSKFFTSLRPGEQGGYATDPKYADSMRKILKTAHQWMPIGTAAAQSAQKSGIATAAPQQEDDTVYDPMTGIPMYGSQTRGPELNTTIRESLGLGNPENRKIIEEAEAAKKKQEQPSAPYPDESYWDEYRRASESRRNAAAQKPPTPQTIIESAKATMTPEQQKKSGFQPEDWLRLGFSLMSGKSPYALQNLGSAGIATLEGIKDREKMAQDAASKNAQSKLYEAQARALNLAEKYDLTKQKLVLDAIKDAHAAVEKWESGLGGIQSLNDKTARDRKFKEELDLRMQAIKMAYPDINIPTTMPQAEKTSNWKLVGVEKQ